jgi:hypothetical protein
VAQQERVVTARTFCADLLTSVLMTHEKLQKFERLWPEVVSKLVHETVQEHSDMDQHMRTLLENLK